MDRSSKVKRKITGIGYVFQELWIKLDLEDVSVTMTSIQLSLVLYLFIFGGAFTNPMF